MRKLAVTLAVLPLLLVASTLAIASIASDPTTPASTVSTVSGLTADQLAIYQQAADICPGLSWAVLAGIGDVESHHGGPRYHADTADVLPPLFGPALDGRDGRELLFDPSAPDGYAHARGPMQFLPNTWKRWARVGPGRPTDTTPSIDNLADAAASAAAKLCGGNDHLVDIDRALYAYNPSWNYVHQVEDQAASYATRAGPSTTSEPLAQSQSGAVS